MPNRGSALNFSNSRFEIISLKTEVAVEFHNEVVVETPDRLVHPWLKARTTAEPGWRDWPQGRFTKLMKLCSCA